MTQTKQPAALPLPTRKIVYSTTDGRQKFPDLLQDIYGDKVVIGFDRYGRVLGAVVPMEAVAMLAGQKENVDDYTQGRIELAAKQLMERASESKSGFASIETIEAMRNIINSPNAPKSTTKRKRGVA